MGASPLQIIRKVLIPEALPAIVLVILIAAVQPVQSAGDRLARRLTRR